MTGSEARAKVWERLGWADLSHGGGGAGLGCVAPAMAFPEDTIITKDQNHTMKWGRTADEIGSLQLPAFFATYILASARSSRVVGLSPALNAATPMLSVIAKGPDGVSKG